MKRLASLALFLVLLALAGTAIEAVLEVRLARRTYREAALRFHPFLQVVPSPEHLDGVNDDRFRGDPVPVEKPQGTLRIFTLGGSTTLGVKNSFEESYPRLLEARLRAHYPSMRIEVENAGVDWYTTAHSLVNYVLRVRRFNPDLVIAMHAINDLSRSFAPPWFADGPFKADYSHYLGPQIAFLGPQTGFQEDYDRGGWILWRRLRQVVRRDPSPLDLSAQGVERLRARLREVDVSSFRSLDSFRANYDLLVRTIRSDGHAVILGSEPSLYKDDLTADEARVIWFPAVFCAEGGTYPSVRSMRDGMRAFNEAARDVARAHGVPFIDFAATVPKSLTYLQDDVHLTRAGNDMLAQMAALWIINNPVPPLPPLPAATAEHHR